MSWYFQFPVSYRDLELMLADRSGKVDHVTLSDIAQIASTPGFDGAPRRAVRQPEGLPEVRSRAVLLMPE